MARLLLLAPGACQVGLVFDHHHPPLLPSSQSPSSSSLSPPQRSSSNWINFLRLSWLVEGIENAAAVLLETTKVLRPFKILIFPIIIPKQPKPSYCNSIIFRWLNLENLASKVPVWNFVYFVSFILRLEWQDEVGMTKNSHSRVILKGMMIKRDLTSHPSSRSFEVILTWNDLRMTKYTHSVVIPGWLGMNFRLHEKSPDFWAGPWRVQGMMWNDARMM